MDIEKINEMGKWVDRFMRLKTNSLGVKFYEKAESVPKEFKRFDRPQPVCAVFGWSRFLEIPVVLTRDKMVPCPAATLSLGWGKLPDNFEELVVGLFAETKENALKVVKGGMSLNGKYEAFAVCPLDRITVEPDIVQMWPTPLQLLMIEQANTWNGWPRVKLEGNGHGASCYEALTIPFLTKEIRFSVPDMGDRRHGMAQDDEMLCGFPFDKLELIIDALKKNQNDMNAFPIIYNLDAPFPVPNSVLKMKFPKYETAGIYKDEITKEMHS